MSNTYQRKPQAELTGAESWKWTVKLGLRAAFLKGWAAEGSTESPSLDTVSGKEGEHIIKLLVDPSTAAAAK